MEYSEKKVRVRFAPSPTGHLHVGGLRTALYNYLFAQKNGGDFILRIEDTDRSRYVEGAVESLIGSLLWSGMRWNEGAFLKNNASQLGSTMESGNYPGIIEAGEFGPYVQSERLAVYKKYAEQLVAEGKAYYCFCEPERLERMRQEQQENKKPPMYDRYCLTQLTPDKINENLKNNCPATIRLKVPKDEIVTFDDLVRGKVSFNTNTLDDQIILKSDGFPTYHLASVVDDHLMQITHVLRAEEWLPSTPKHILLYRAFGWDMPTFAHLPQLLSVDKKKLSKRMGDVAVEDYIAKGYLKEAIVNFVALLGWNPGKGSTQEIFSMEQLIEAFDIAHVHKAGAVFDLKKLDWINAQYIKKLTSEELMRYAMPHIEKKEWYANAPESKKEREYLRKVLIVEQDRLMKFSEVGDENVFFFADILADKEMLRWKGMSDEQLKASLEKAYAALESLERQNWELKTIENCLLKAAGEKRGELLWPLRVALTGAQKSPSPFEVAWVLGKTNALQRIAKAISQI